MATVAVVIGALVLVSVYPFGHNPLSTTGGVTCSSFRTSFVIVADNRGFNDSIDHLVSQKYWPVMCVHQGDTVRIVVENHGDSEPHGFAIVHYYVQGVSIPANTNVTISFTADQSGSFPVFCNTFCSVHAYMLSGMLVVS